MGSLLTLFSGYKTIVAGLGMIGLGLWYLSQGEYDAAITKISEGLGLIGLRGAVATIAPATATPAKPAPTPPAK